MTMRPVLSLAFLAVMMVNVAVAELAPAVPGGSAQTVLVLPFTPPGGQDYQWAGQSVRQAVAADLAHGSRLNVITPASAAPAADAAEALRIAADAGASIVVSGQTQVIGK